MTTIEKTRPIIPFNSDLLDEVSDSLNLRKPQAMALSAVAETFESHPQGFTGTCDLATAVGKTRLAAGIISYLARHDAKVRNFLVVVPNRTVYKKTIDNFTKGHSKSVLNGMGVAPVVVTPENFATAGIASWLDDDRFVKVFVFNVQQLLSDTKEMSRRVRAIQEYLGTSLYGHLTELSDLVVLSDEHHMYSEKASRYNAAIQDLEPLATIGLTATPACTILREGITPTGRAPKIHTHSPGGVEGKCKIIFHYPLAMAIADKLVKTPCIVGRTDDQVTEEIKLRDGLIILDAKRDAANIYTEQRGTDKVNPIMLVVCQNIGHADATADTLRGMPEMANQDVLVIHSNTDEESLTALYNVESADNKVRVIVSVNMLGVGWDVKNVFVILSLRASVAEVLTEQTLGRGMRLPWEVYTGNAVLDTIDVVAHESYQKVLDKAEILLEGLASAEHVKVLAQYPRTEELMQRRERDSNVDDYVLGVGVTSMEERQEDVAKQVAEMKDRTIKPERKLSLPIVTVVSKTVYVNLTELRETDFQSWGVSWATRDRAELVRNEQRFSHDGDSLVYNAVIAEDKLHAALGRITPGYVEDVLIKALSTSQYVVPTPEADNRARILVRAFILGAGGEDVVLPNLRVVVTEIKSMLERELAKRNPEKEISVVMEAKLLTRTLKYHNATANKSVKFDKGTVYNGWSKGLHSYVKFDSSTERKAAVDLFDNDSQVKLWAWLDKTQKDLPIPLTGGGYYYPDFYVSGEDGKHYVIEIKADTYMSLPSTIVKKNAGVLWAKTVSDKDGGKYGEWVYLLVSETMVKDALNFAQLRQVAVKESSSTAEVSWESWRR